MECSQVSAKERQRPTWSVLSICCHVLSGVDLSRFWLVCDVIANTNLLKGRCTVRVGLVCSNVLGRDASEAVSRGMVLMDSSLGVLIILEISTISRAHRCTSFQNTAVRNARLRSPLSGPQQLTELKTERKRMIAD